MKKQAIIATAAVLTLAFTGCGRDAAAPGGAAPSGGGASVGSGKATGTLSVWAMGSEGELLKQMTDKFVAENPDVKVNVTAIPWDSAHTKFTSATAANQTPDVAQVGTTWMGEFAQYLDATPGEIDKAGFFEGAQKTTEVNGQSMGVPWYVETRVVYYNKAVAQKAGITDEPKTWDEFTAMVKAMKEKGGAKYGISLLPGGTGSWQTVLPLMWSNGGKVVTDDNKSFTFDDPKNVEALKYYQDFFTQGLANKAPVGDTLASDFKAGTVPMFISGPWMMEIVEKAGTPKDGYGVFVMPKKESSASFVGGSNLAVFKATKNRDAAWKLVEYLSKPENQVEWYKISKDLTSVKSSWDDPALKADPKLAIFGEQLNTAYAPPSITTWEQVAGKLDAQVEKVTKTGADPAAALKTVQADASSIGLG